MDVGADDFRFPIFHLAWLTLESDRARSGGNLSANAGRGEKKRPTRKESSVCKSELKRAAIHPLEWTSYTHCVRKRREKKTESMNRCHDTAIQSEYKACSKRKSATAGIKKGVFFVPPPRTMRNTLRRVENNLTRSLAGLHCCSRGSVTSLHENWSDVIGSNTWDKNLGIGKFHGLLLAS